MAIGYNALGATTTGDYNIAIGYNAGAGSTSAANNVAIGYYSQQLLNTGKNILAGTNTLQYNTASDNVAIGHSAAQNTTTATNTIFIGLSAGQDMKTGNRNVGIGDMAMNGAPDATGANNTAIGFEALTAEFAGASNIALGYQAMHNNTDGNYNTAIGNLALEFNVANSNSVAIGHNAMLYADSRVVGRTTYNTAIGYEFMRGSATAANNTGQNNTAVGYQTLDAMTSGEQNTVIGVDAGGAITTGSNNILLGYQVGNALTTESNRMYLGNAATDSTCIEGKTAFIQDIWYEDTYWEDLRVDQTTFTFAGNNDPTLVTYDVGGSGFTDKIYEFDLDDEAFFKIQIPHDFKQNSDFYVHLHWTPGARGNEEGVATVGWKVQFMVADINEAFPNTYYTCDLFDACTFTDHIHLMTPAILQDVGTTNISAFIIGRVYRSDTGTDDTWATNTTGNLPLFLGVDFHYELDAPGSRTPTTK